LIEGFSSMLYHEQSEDYRPLFWMSGRPIYANTILLTAHITAFVVAALCISYLGPNAVYNALCLDPSRIWHEGQVWRFFSYIAYDPYFFTQRSLWFLWSMLLLFFFGREVEQFAGRKTYLALYAALVFIPAILLSLLGLLISTGPHLNCFEAIFGMFVAFATLYPGAMPIFFWIPFRASILVWVLLAIFSLIDLADHAFTALFMLWTSSAVGYLAMRFIGAGRGLTWLTDWVEDRQAKRLAQQRNIKVLKDVKETESIDDILEKISKQGVGSLNAKERAALERARTNLLKRDQR
jgi:membrane associated rhomboid family serine protease